MTWRYYAYRLNGDGTDTLLTADLPLGNARIVQTLNSAPMIDADISPEIMSLKGDDGRPILEEWSTGIFAEQNGVIRAGGILTTTVLKNDVLELTVDGYMAYPDKQGWVDAPALFYEADPAAIYRFAWRELQKHPRGNLGVVVDDLVTPARLGRRAKGDPNAGGTSDEPIVFAQYHTTDLGKDLNDILSAGSVEIAEIHRWDGGQIVHQMALSYPRRGSRSPYRFVIGENVIEVPRVQPNADMYASSVVVVGAGEGPAAITGVAHSSRTDRLRRVTALSRQDLANSTLVSNYAAEQLRRREIIHDDVDEFIIRDTPHAPVGGVSPGDEIQVMGPSGWAGTLDQAYRVLSIEHTPDSTSAAVFKVTPTDKAY